MLPFTNMSGDMQQEYFADGMVEDAGLIRNRESIRLALLPLLVEAKARHFGLDERAVDL